MVSCCTLKKTQTLPKAKLHWPLSTTDLVTSPSNSCSPSTITATPFSSQDTPGSSLHEDTIRLLLSVPSTKSILSRISLCGFLSLPCQLNCHLLKETLVFNPKYPSPLFYFIFFIAPMVIYLSVDCCLLYLSIMLHMSRNLLLIQGSILNI